MSDPLERINRLREQTAKARPGPWQADTTDGEWACPLVLETTADNPDEPGTPMHYVIAEARHGYTQNADAEHIARWDPEAAGYALHLLDGVLARHKPLDGGTS